jgi:hypothetical protein
MIQEEILKISSVFQKSLKEIIREKINLGSAFMVTFRPDTSWENVIEIDEDEETYTVMLNEETLLYTFIEKRNKKDALHFTLEGVEYVIPLEDIEVLWLDKEYTVNILRNPVMVKQVEYQFYLEEEEND